MPLSRDLREFIECLNSNRVEYVVVGAFAVSWHGFPRYSGDIDFLVRPSATNAALVVRAIEQFGLVKEPSLKENYRRRDQNALGIIGGVTG